MTTDRARRTVTTRELSGVEWHVSSRSTSGGANCVEAGPVADGSGRVAVRHSHHPCDATFVYDRGEWDTFLAAAKHGRFDFTA